MRIIKINGCVDCPMLDMNDMCGGYTCNFIKHFRDEIKDDFVDEDKKSLPITPEWCPLKKDNYQLEFNR